MKFKLIACNVFKYEIEHCAKSCEHELDIDYIELGEHIHPETLRGKLQLAIDDIAGKKRLYDAVLLGYGLCGRTTDGLIARREPVVLPRSHDCGGVLLGSRKKFEEYFKDMPSTPFSSPGYVENGKYFFQDEMILGDDYQALVEQYGEDNARYVYEAMHPVLDGVLQPIHYIETPEFRFDHLREQCRCHAAEEGRGFKILEGSLRLISMLLNGEWPDDEFLTVNAGQKITMIADWDRIITCH